GATNLTGPGRDISVVSVENIPPGAPLPTGKPGGQPQQGQGDDVERFTRALAITDNPGMKTALAARLQDALRQKNENVDVKTIKDENGNEHILFVDKKARTVTDAAGHSY